MKAFENAQGCQRVTLPGKTQQLELFTDPAEQRRAERLKRVARLAATTHTTAAKHLFDAAGEAEARRIAEGTGGHRASRPARA